MNKKTEKQNDLVTSGNLKIYIACFLS